ncbi:MAG TPA: alpha/beta hydrolase [Lacipirellulaceae bacterium]|jgi:acetyl esterase/lipase
MNQRIAAVLLLVFTRVAAAAADPIQIPLWKDGAPGTPATKPEDEPTLYLTRPAADGATKTAVIICPGGGYGHLSMDKEGSEIAEWFNSFGVTAFVLRYRHHGTGHMHPVPMLDGKRAVRTVRSRAGEWNIDPEKIGVMGFSAGGHLASTLGTHVDAGDSTADDPIERASSRPDFLILCYPVVSMTADYMHKGSRDNLIGKDADPDLARNMSSELQVTAQTPPTFIFQTNADKTVPAENAVSFYLALRKANVPAELHIYQNGNHGLGQAKTITGTADWPARCQQWMQVRGLLEPAAK